jgi:hypothetical protein
MAWRGVEIGGYVRVYELQGTCSEKGIGLSNATLYETYWEFILYDQAFCYCWY